MILGHHGIVFNIQMGIYIAGYYHNIRRFRHPVFQKVRLAYKGGFRTMTLFMMLLLNNVTVGPVHNGAINNPGIPVIYRQMNVYPPLCSQTVPL